MLEHPLNSCGKINNFEREKMYKKMKKRENVI